MSNTPYYQMLSKPRVFLWRMLLFVMLAGLVGIILYKDLSVAFEHNKVLNSLILGVLTVGILYTFQQVLHLYPEVRWVNSFRIETGFSNRFPVMLAPMATLLQRAQGEPISPTAMRSMLDSIASRLDESRETTRYLVGLLVFLGLLGTFWGLMQTVQSVGDTIDALKPTSENGFETLKNGLSQPLRGMGVAFSASLFGLAGSLIVGFLDLQASHAQARFYNELEEWLSDITELTPENGGFMRSNSGDAMIELSRGIDRLVKQMRVEQKAVRDWLDEQTQQHQAELANVMREQSRLASILRDVAGRSPHDR
jgi:hypothetical protein